MFGYVLINKSDLDKNQIDTYRSYYCGLCDTLEKGYGKSGMSILSYDLTFIYLLLSDLYNTNNKVDVKRCITHPIKEHKYLTNELSSYISDMQILVSYFSLLDKTLDKDSKGSAKSLKKLKEYIPELEKKYPRQYKALYENYNLIRELEEKKDDDVVNLSSVSGSMICEIFAPKEDIFAPILRDLGKGIGSFIYIMDAYDDLKKDIKRNHFNPLKNVDGDLKSYVKELLELSLSQAAGALEKLPLDDNLPILRNIIYSGSWTKFEVKR